jgi:hypothetical protein
VGHHAGACVSGTRNSHKLEGRDFAGGMGCGSFVEGCVVSARRSGVRPKSVDLSGWCCRGVSLFCISSLVFARKGMWTYSPPCDGRHAVSVGAGRATWDYACVSSAGHEAGRDVRDGGWGSV